MRIRSYLYVVAAFAVLGRLQGMDHVPQLHIIHDHDSQRWIEKRIESAVTRSWLPWRRNPVDPLCVRHFAPRGFEAYVKIFHPIFEDREVEDRTVTWDDAKRPTMFLGIDDDEEFVDEILRDVTVTYQSTAVDELHRVRWSELANRYDIALHPEFGVSSFTRRFGGSWPLYLSGPMEGNLGGESVSDLTVLTSVVELWNSGLWQFHWGVMHHIDDESAVHVRGHGDDGCGTMQMRALPREMAMWVQQSDADRMSPEYWWPLDRSACIVSNFDLPYTFVAGPQELADRLLHTPELEVHRVELSNVVDAPGPNDLAELADERPTLLGRNGESRPRDFIPDD